MGSWAVDEGGEEMERTSNEGIAGEGVRCERPGLGEVEGDGAAAAAAASMNQIRAKRDSVALISRSSDSKLNVYGKSKPKVLLKSKGYSPHHQGGQNL